MLIKRHNFLNQPPNTGKVNLEVSKQMFQNQMRGVMGELTLASDMAELIQF